MYEVYGTDAHHPMHVGVVLAEPLDPLYHQEEWRARHREDGKRVSELTGRGEDGLAGERKHEAGDREMEWMKGR